jgi:hypothetical protein
LVFAKPVKSIAPIAATLVVGFHTKGLFSSLSRFAGAAADVVDAAGAALLGGSAELDELDGLSPPNSAHATSNASRRYA